MTSIIANSLGDLDYLLLISCLFSLLSIVSYVRTRNQAYFVFLDIIIYNFFLCIYLAYDPHISATTTTFELVFVFSAILYFILPLAFAKFIESHYSFTFQDYNSGGFLKINTFSSIMGVIIIITFMNLRIYETNYIVLIIVINLIIFWGLSVYVKIRLINLQHSIFLGFFDVLSNETVISDRLTAADKSNIISNLSSLRHVLTKRVYKDMFLIINILMYNKSIENSHKAEIINSIFKYISSGQKITPNQMRAINILITDTNLDNHHIMTRLSDYLKI